MKTRYRVETRLFKNPLVVLQVGEERITGEDYENAPPSCHNKKYTYWRDANVEDLLELELNA